MELLESVFKLKEHKTSFKKEILAGLATFLTMAYIMVVNPAILSETGMDFDSVFVATILASFVACMIMGILANWPVALAPGMGLNAFFTYAVVFGMGFSWQQALAAVLCSGVLFLVISISPLRAYLINAIPRSLKFGIGQPIKRKEDDKFLTGSGCYNDDINLKDQVYMHILRSPFSFAAITNINFKKAKELDGILEILTNESIKELKINPMYPGFKVKNKDGSEMIETYRPILAEKKVRYVGEPILAIIAETIEIAEEAVDLIDIEFEEYYENLDKWISKNHIREIYLPYVTQGNWKKIYKKITKKYPDINFIIFNRKYDVNSWIFSKKGYFKFKLNIPKLITKI